MKKNPRIIIFSIIRSNFKKIYRAIFDKSCGQKKKREEKKSKFVPNFRAIKVPLALNKKWSQLQTLVCLSYHIHTSDSFRDKTFTKWVVQFTKSTTYRYRKGRRQKKKSKTKTFQIMSNHL